MTKSVAEYYAKRFRSLGYNSQALTHGWDDLKYIVLVWLPMKESTAYTKGSSCLSRLRGDAVRMTLPYVPSQVEGSLELLNYYCHSISENIAASGKDNEFRQVLCLSEEAGEFVGAFRRYKGLARRSGTKQEMAHELADVVIAAFTTSHSINVDLTEAIGEKLEIIFNRGGL